MQPYYQDDLVTLYHGDCREVTEWLSAHVLITDPPYGMSYVSNSSKVAPTAPIEGDGNPELRDTVLDLWTFGPALVFGTWRVPRPRECRHLLVWDKGASPGMGDLRLPWGPSHEEVYVIGEGFIGNREASVLRVRTLPSQSEQRPNHPTPKPVSLMEQLLLKCPPSWTIADPFAGSGTTLCAARNLGRPAIGVELEERYCELIAKRLAQDVLDFGAA